MNEFCADSVESGQRFLMSEFERLKKNVNIFLFKGDLGSGKTTYISQIIKSMTGEKYINSPTYTIINTYQGKEYSVFHADLYRLEDEEDVFETGLIDMMYEEKSFFFIEWPDRFMNIFDDMSYVIVEINNKNENSREIKIHENIIY